MHRTQARDLMADGSRPERQRPDAATERRLLACLESGPPDIGTLWEICLHWEFDRDAAVDGIEAWLGPPDGLRVLDCACGSGFPALALLQRGYDVTCSDGSALMLRHLERNARLEAVDVAPHQVLWEDLRQYFGPVFDVVMCRGGGSYLYAGTWDTDGTPTGDALSGSVRQFIDCVRPGGRLYVDVTRAEDLARTEPQWSRRPRLLVGQHTVDLEELITLEPERGMRVWHSWLSIDGTCHEFERRSHFLPHDALVGLLREGGLEDVHAEPVPGEHYDVYVGRRPG